LVFHPFLGPINVWGNGWDGGRGAGRDRRRERGISMGRWRGRSNGRGGGQEDREIPLSCRSYITDRYEERLQGKLEAPPPSIVPVGTVSYGIPGKRHFDKYCRAKKINSAHLNVQVINLDRGPTSKRRIGNKCVSNTFHVLLDSTLTM
jgi:hypothetical protein